MVHKRRWMVPLAVVVGLAATAAVGTARAATGTPAAWAQYRFGADHRGYNPDETVLTSSTVSRLTSKWSHQLQTGTPVVVSGGVVYAASQVAFRAYDATTGAIRWTATPPAGDGFRSAPSLSGTRVYVGTSRGTVTALDARTGARLWSVKIGVNPLLNAPVVSGGLVYSNGDETTSDRAVLYALDAATGTVRWRSAPAGGISFDSPAVAGGIAYFSGGNDHTLHALDATTGRPLWTSPDTGAPVVANGRVYLAGNPDSAIETLLARDAKTGRLLWSTKLPGAAPAPAVDGSRVYVGVVDVHDDSRTLYAYDATTGKVLWHSARVPGLQFDAISTPSVGGGVVYLDAADHLRAYAATNGALRWTAPQRGSGADAVVVGGRLYVVTSNSRGTTSVRAFGL